jgi:pSer/pThr/pTyr-binding forkhead associated (FHA) protein
MLMSGARLVPDLDGTDGPPFILGALTTIGRTPDNSIPLDKPEVSRRHARLMLGDDGTYTLVDNGSNNGTYVNGDRVSEHKLKNGDRIQIGTHHFFFRER